jgi:hypothetical protein
MGQCRFKACRHHSLESAALEAVVVEGDARNGKGFDVTTIFVEEWPLEKRTNL